MRLSLTSPCAPCVTNHLRDAEPRRVRGRAVAVGSHCHWPPHGPYIFWNARLFSFRYAGLRYLLPKSVLNGEDKIMMIS